jgi:hypothetical protein
MPISLCKRGNSDADRIWRAMLAAFGKDDQRALAVAPFAKEGSDARSAKRRICS